MGRFKGPLTVRQKSLSNEAPSSGVTSRCLYGHFTSTTPRPHSEHTTTASGCRCTQKQEAQLMLTNLRDAFGGQSRTSNIVPFHMLGILSYCAIVTLSLRRAVLRHWTSKKCRNLEMGVKGHSRSLRVVLFDRRIDRR